MKCFFCDSDEMEIISGADDPEKGYAYNLYQCRMCDAICKQDVWKHKGEIWISNDGAILRF